MQLVLPNRNISSSGYRRSGFSTNRLSYNVGCVKGFLVQANPCTPKSAPVGPQNSVHLQIQLTDSDRIARVKDFGGAWPMTLTYR